MSILINFFIKEGGLILVLLENFQDALLISVGAVFGVNARFLIYKKLEIINLSKQYVISLINILASFFLGVFISILPQINSLSYSYELGLFFSIGFLGSFSTFSTFIYDLYDLIIQLKFYRALILLIISLALGILAFSVGYSLVR